MGRVDENAELGRVIAEGAESGLISDKLVELLYIQDIGKSLAVIADHIQPTRPTARWSRQTDTYHDYYECENCGMGVGLDDVRNFCPNCGARMVEPQESEV